MRRRHAAALVVLGLASALLSAPAAQAHDSGSPTVTVLNTTAFGGGLGGGSTVGPDGALYVTNGREGTLVRVDPRTGGQRVVGVGLPLQVLDIGGAMDAVFLRGRAYVLVTVAGSDVGGTAPMGIYRQGDDGQFSLFADIGAWAQAHPPADPDYFLSQGVQYAIDVWHDTLVVTDAHLGRIMQIDRQGRVCELLAFPSTNSVPTGLDSTHGRLYVATAGPIPHLPSTARIEQVERDGDREVVGRWASSYTGHAGLIVDVETGLRGALYGLLQGHWDLPPLPENEGSPAAPNTGEIVVVGRDGTFRTVVSGIDVPTSFEFIGRSAFVVTLSGAILRIDGI